MMIDEGKMKRGVKNGYKSDRNANVVLIVRANSQDILFILSTRT